MEGKLNDEEDSGRIILSRLIGQHRSSHRRAGFGSMQACSRSVL